MGSGWVKHLVGRTLWKVAPCVCELAVMIVTLDQRWRGLSLCESTRLNTEKCWVGLGEVVESAIMVVTLDQRWLVLSTGWVVFGQAFGRSNAVESCPSLPSWSSRTR